MRYAILFAVAVLFAGPVGAADPALDVLNKQRSARGLYPYILDANLQASAENLARFRAANLIAGHTANDFAGCVPGCNAQCTGCSAWEGWVVAQLGFGSCQDYSQEYRYAGAAWETGKDGRIYSHLVLSNSPTSSVSTVAANTITAESVSPVSLSQPMTSQGCAGGNCSMPQSGRRIGRRR